MESYETLKLHEQHLKDKILILELNRPGSMNSLNTKMGEELITCFNTLRNRKDFHVLILTASGEKSFCAGADLKERKGMTNQEWKEQHDIFENAYALIRNFPFPVIGAVNGFALGGGMELALSCDLRYAATHAKMGLPEVTLGIIPGVGGTQLLPRAIPVHKAKELLFSGKHITADEATELNLLNGTAEKEELLDTVLKVARDIAKNAPLSLKGLKKAVNTGVETDLNTGLTIELDQYYTCANSEDRKEGILAFNEKRKPGWKGE